MRLEVAGYFLSSGKAGYVHLIGIYYAALHLSLARVGIS
jgi:hypothetical protein